MIVINKEYTLEEMEDIIMDSVVPCQCLECGDEIALEPDAKTGWCYGCDKVSKVWNPVMEFMAGNVDIIE